MPEKRINYALIMAAGRGSRMMPLTNDIPKAMAEYKGTSLIIRGIDEIRPLIKNIYITVGYRKSQLAAHVIEHGVSGVINTEGKGNAWWIYNTLFKHLNKPLFLLTCDNIISLDFQKLANDYFDLGAPACMVVPVSPVDGLEGDYITHQNQKVKALDRYSPTDFYCSGIQVINPGKVNEITEKSDDFYAVWNQLMAKGELYCSRVTPDNWYTVDTLEQLEKANKSL